jgi:phosphoglycolate phosphatase
LHIATSKLRSMAVQVVEHAGWSDLFAVVGGSESDGSRYLKRDIIEWTLAQLTDQARPIAMVGDRAGDIAGGLAVGLPGIGVTWGYGSLPELTDAGAAAIAESPRELIGLLKALC